MVPRHDSHNGSTVRSPGVQSVPPALPPSRDAEDEDEEDDAPPSSEGSGAGHVLPPDNLYQEPNEVPIPHHSKRERPDS